MKTTLVIDDGIMTKLRERAASDGMTISSLVEAALRLLLDRPTASPARKLAPLPSYHGGQFLVDVADRAALDRVYDEDQADLYRRATVAAEPAAVYGTSKPARRRKPRA